MNNNLIDKNSWKEFFEFASKNAKGQQIELEIIGMDIGDQIEEEWVNLVGMSYDPNEEILFVHTATDDHPILKPQEVVSSVDGSVTHSIAVKDSNGVVQIIKFRTPLRIEGEHVKH